MSYSPRPRPLAERFEEKVVRRGHDECWSWIGAKRKGRGAIWDLSKRRAVEASRASWELAVGPIPEGMEVCHKCDNPECTNPNHLFVGTHYDNMQDMIRKGRNRPSGAKGISNYKAKLTEDQVVSIWLSQGQPAKHLAVAFNVSTSAIKKIWARRTWTHMPLDHATHA